MRYNFSSGKMTLSRWEKRILLILSLIGIIGATAGVWAAAFLSAGTMGQMVLTSICGGI
jgi:hypothetical protein